MRPAFTLIFAFVLFSCRNNSSDQHNLALLHSNNTNEINSAPADTIHIDKIILLNDPQVKVLKSGMYHDGEIDPLLSHRLWKGLFTRAGKNYISDAEVKIIRSFDDMMDQPGQKTGQLVKVNNKDTSVLLISGIQLKNGPINQLPLSSLQILPGEKFQFKYNNGTYRLFATGQKKLIDSAGKEYNVTAYKLFVETTIRGHHYIQLLVNIPHYEGPFHTGIKFAGDIDNDAIPDFIIDISNYYGSENATLYLSRPSKNNVLYTIIGGITAAA